MQLGIIVNLRPDIEESFRQLKETGLSGCQLSAWDESLFTGEIAEKIRSLTKELGVKISTFWCGWPGPQVWDFYEGQLTLGLVPPEYRHVRAEVLKRGSDFAKLLGVDQLATHAGFIPENPNDPAYHGTAAALRDVLARCRKNGQKLLFETGQETPVTLRRLMEDLGNQDVGINFDPANLLMYGKANPVDALDILGKYVLDVHAKDGEYPVDGRNLGEEKPLGKGRVDFPRFIARLKELGYDGPVTIEREISGGRQRKDILDAIQLLKGLL
ncbi:MAG: sugar phosphate isomerase/epimerase [Treponema sp.]|jgi:sugar phosphate isomerase/epimerase|nr:sugar phosphate isomerase/epimerase [Treponema sp.]